MVGDTKSGTPRVGTGHQESPAFSTTPGAYFRSDPEAYQTPDRGAKSYLTTLSALALSYLIEIFVVSLGRSADRQR